jgi:CobQ-like glutamine amidotransferase family enzyme
MKKKETIAIGYLYGSLMNIYGDTGNIITLQKRLEWRGYKTKVVEIGLDTKLESGMVDIFFFGGGQDQSQQDVAKDLLKSKGKVIKAEIERGVPLLSICGGYQLLGDYYRPQKGPKIGGIGLFPVFTDASTDRMIGNIVVSTQFGDLVGFENHSGKTYLKKNALPLGTVETGFGNNGQDKTEGCIYKNAIGCYMHGSLLPKNPHLADWLIRKALEVKLGHDIVLESLDDKIEMQAHTEAINTFSNK